MLNGGAGNDSIFGHEGNDTLSGEADDDYVDGGTGDDGLYGGGGADVLYGFAGNDWIDGGDGNDSISGDEGIDGLFGGAGVDLFIYTATNESTLWSGDWINDFVAGTDKLDISAIATAVDVIGSALFSGTGGAEWRSYDVSGNTVNHLDINGDSVADFEIVMAGQVSITESDLLFN